MDGLKGVIIVSNPESGEILAMISSPDYDPSLFSGFVSNKDWKSLIENTDRPLLNRAINGTYPPGSIFKLLNGLIALEENILDENKIYSCTNGFEYEKNKFVKCHPHKPFTNLEQAIAISCNTYFFLQ